MFKKLVLLFLLVLSTVSILYAEDTGVCGKSYMITMDHEMYILKFKFFFLYKQIFFFMSIKSLFI